MIDDCLFAVRNMKLDRVDLPKFNIYDWQCTWRDRMICVRKTEDIHNSRIILETCGVCFLGFVRV